MSNCRLSVNINKFATLRNARGGNNPDVIKAALDCEKFGTEGVTVHPRPDERHIRYSDVIDLKKVISTELNIEGNPVEQKFVDLVTLVRPAQVTLVPDVSSQLTSDHGWDTITHADYLKEVIAYFKNIGVRTSIFLDPIEEMVRGAAEVGTDRIELYTESYAGNYAKDKEKAVKDYCKAAELAMKLGLGINAGHDLSLENLAFFAKRVPGLKEVSIGHALICDALYLGLEKTIRAYRECL